MDANTFAAQGKFLLIALDHRGSFRKILNNQNPQAVTDEEIVEVKDELLNSMIEESTGCLVDVEHRQVIESHKNKPVLLAIEQSGYKEVDGERVTELAYTVEALKSFGASGVKLLLYFNPRLPLAEEQIDTVKKVLANCRLQKLPLFLEILTYTKESNDPSPELILESLQLFLERNIIPDVFKLEYPGNVENCKKVTQLVGKTPWILLTRADPYEVFVNKLRIACMNGASGFLAGRALWQEIAYKQGAERSIFIHDTVGKRFHEICTIVKKNSFLV